MEWRIEKAPPWVVAGCMSGTSLDGVDVAILETDGERIHRFGASTYRPYSESERKILAEALGRWDGAEINRASSLVEGAHIEALQELASFQSYDLIGFHGQTVAHDPAGKGTLQIGSGARLANVMRKPVVWDFRSDDVAAGGQGAPLAPLFHFALAKHLRANAPIVVLNLGGVGNLTYVDPRKSRVETPDALLAFDTGPANAPINDVMRARLGQSFDADGRLALQGNADKGVLDVLMAHAYFREPAPKSLDRNDFDHAIELVAPLPDADAVATLAAFVVLSVVKGLESTSHDVQEMWVTGGGRKNQAIMQGLRAYVPRVLSAEEAGFDGDMLEAHAFAHLAARSVLGLPVSLPKTTGVRLPMPGGKLAQL